MEPITSKPSPRSSGITPAHSWALSEECPSEISDRVSNSSSTEIEQANSPNSSRHIRPKTVTFIGVLVYHTPLLKFGFEEMRDFATFITPSPMV
jgi:hypothetical protein